MSQHFKRGWVRLLNISREIWMRDIFSNLKKRLDLFNRRRNNWRVLMRVTLKKSIHWTDNWMMRGKMRRLNPKRLRYWWIKPIKKGRRPFQIIGDLNRSYRETLLCLNNLALRIKNLFRHWNWKYKNLMWRLRDSRELIRLTLKIILCSKHKLHWCKRK